MRKRWQLFIVSALSVFLLVIAIPFAYSQGQENCKKNEHSVTLGGTNLFCIDNKIKADEIETVVQLIADDFGIQPENIQILKEVRDDKININLADQKIESLTPKQASLVEANIKKIQKNINQYREKLKKYTVFLDNKPIFIVPANSQALDPTGSHLYSREKRAKIISERIKKIADQSSIHLNDLEVEEWEEGTINVVLGSDVIVTLTDDDAKAAKIGVKNKKKLARLYRKRINNAIDNYRQQHKSLDWRWWSGIILALLLLFLWLIREECLFWEFTNLQITIRSYQFFSVLLIGFLALISWNLYSWFNLDNPVEYIAFITPAILTVAGGFYASLEAIYSARVEQAIEYMDKWDSNELQQRRITFINEFAPQKAAIRNSLTHPQDPVSDELITLINNIVNTTINADPNMSLKVVSNFWEKIYFLLNYRLADKKLLREAFQSLYQDEFSQACIFGLKVLDGFLSLENSHLQNNNQTSDMIKHLENLNKDKTWQ